MIDSEAVIIMTQEARDKMLADPETAKQFGQAVMMLVKAGINKITHVSR